MKKFFVVIVMIVLLMISITLLSAYSTYEDEPINNNETSYTNNSTTRIKVNTTTIEIIETNPIITTEVTLAEKETVIIEPVTEMYISNNGLNLIKSFEGFSQYPYSDYSQWSIGYGSYVCGIEEDPYKIYPNGISKEEAEQKLLQTINTYIKAVNNFALEYQVQLTQNQFDALVSFTYNVGANVWKRDPSNFKIKALLIAGDYSAEEMEEAFYKWRYAGGKELTGLANRRLKEAALFNTIDN